MSTLALRWSNTVFMCAFADAIQHVHKDCKKKTHAIDAAIIFFAQCPTLSLLFFFVIECSVLTVLVFITKVC